jgi:hypothetical protein
MNRLRRFALPLITLCMSATALFAAPIRPQLQATGYVISADLDPATGKLSATVTVTISALEDLNMVTLELNNGLQITRLVDASGRALAPERLTTNSTVRIPLLAPVPKGSYNPDL